MGKRIFADLYGEKELHSVEPDVIIEKLYSRKTQFPRVQELFLFISRCKLRTQRACTQCPCSFFIYGIEYSVIEQHKYNPLVIVEKKIFSSVPFFELEMFSFFQHKSKALLFDFGVFQSSIRCFRRERGLLVKARTKLDEEQWNWKYSRYKLQKITLLGFFLAFID